MKLLHLIVGARPNFMKIAPLYKEFSRYPNEFQLRLIHTGQHYDEKMSKFFFSDLKLPLPDEYLEVGSGSHGEQTARIIDRYEKVLMRDKPDLVFVAGDVNSTAACAIDAVKMNIPVVHIEAGLRSFDKTMPEEINRIITDAIADYLLTPSPDANKNLLAEGKPEEKIYYVGNIMIDSLIKYLPIAKDSAVLKTNDLKENEYGLITLHRPANVDDPKALSIILDALEMIAEKIPLAFPIHPRTQRRLIEFELERRAKSINNLLLIPPVGYYDFLKLEMESRLILTDSGGIQEESTYFGIPCLTLRPNTERPITITEGTNKLVALDIESMVSETDAILQGASKKGKVPKYWDGNTSTRIVEIFRKV